MKIFPAIDLRDGKVVRLYQGDYDQMTVYNDDPVAVVRQFKAAGASHLHVVDLDGAKDGELTNFSTIKSIVEEGGLFVEVGGGIRDEERIRQYLDLGVGRVILGTIAVTDFPFLCKMVETYGEKIAVGVDARDGMVAIHGWKEVTDTESYAFCEKLRDAGVKSVIYTDIAKDGGLQGTNLEAYRRLAQIEGLSVTASGGISYLSEIEKLRDLADAAILGKAIYTGALDLRKAVAVGERGEAL